MKILVISMCLPYKQAKDAGSKIVSYYMGQLLDNNNEIKLISLLSKSQENDISKVDNRIDCYPIVNDKDKKIENYISKHNPFNKYGNTIEKTKFEKIINTANKLKKVNGYTPDVIILEWTYIGFCIDKIKNIWPSAKYVVSEQDVTFLGINRYYTNEQSFLKKWYYFFLYKTIKKNELRILNICDLIIVYNDKDKKLLLDNNVKNEKILSVSPYYDYYNYCKSNESLDILFFGAMSRIENYEAAIWFINNVLYKIDNKEAKFVVIGNKPNKKLLELASDRVLVKGYVENIESYINNSICFVAPLLHGAGIKIKILEMMAAGLPTLTNEIGIEGIFAQDKIEYLFCKKPSDYIETINNIYDGKIDINKLSNNSRKHIKNIFNMEESAIKYIEAINKLYLQK